MSGVAQVGSGDGMRVLLDKLLHLGLRGEAADDDGSWGFYLGNQHLHLASYLLLLLVDGMVK
jgi:hypothetical protein